MRSGLVVVGFALLMSCGDDVPNAALVRVDDEPAGAHCAQGGIAIVSGIDGNTNGVLDEDEIVAAQTRFVCTEASAPAVLTAIDSNVSAADCPYGGNRVRAGLDTNGNNALDDGEVTSTSFACNPRSIDVVRFGTLTLTSAEDVAGLDGIEVVTGSLTVAVKGAVALPTLTIVGEVLRVDVGTVEGVDNALTMPALTQAGSVLFNSGTLVAPELSAVVNTLGYSEFSQVPTTRVVLPSLRSVNQLYFIGQNFGGPAGFGVIETLELPALTRVGQLFITQQQQLTSIALPAITQIDNLSITANAQLATLSLPELRVITQGLTVQSNPLLSTCVAYRTVAQTVPSNRQYSIVISGNATDSACSTNTAETCGTLTIDGAPSKLHVCAVPQTRDAGEAACAALFSGHLASFASADEYADVRATLLTDAWTGFTDVGSDAWQWNDGSTAYVPANNDTTFWRPAEPNGGAGENCARITRTGVIDVSCGDSTALICRAP